MPWAPGMADLGAAQDGGGGWAASSLCQAGSPFRGPLAVSGALCLLDHQSQTLKPGRPTDWLRPAGHFCRESGNSLKG